MASPLPASASAPEHNEILLTPTDRSTSSAEHGLTSYRPPNLQDLQAVATDIKDTLFSAISDLRHEIQAIAGRMHHVEHATAQQQIAVKKIHHRVDSHTLQLRDLQRHVEDLDNRGRRHNLRVRGLPESVEQDQILPAVTDLFNRLLDWPRQSLIAMEQIHRALRP